MGEPKMPLDKEYEDGTHDELAKEKTAEFQKEKSGVKKLAGEKSKE